MLRETIPRIESKLTGTRDISNVVGLLSGAEGFGPEHSFAAFHFS
jgi:hypothetical protein